MPEKFNVFDVVRRYAEAIIAGQITAKQIAEMSDEQLDAYNDILSESLETTQKEAERLAEREKN